MIQKNIASLYLSETGTTYQGDADVNLNNSNVKSFADADTDKSKWEKIAQDLRPVAKFA